MENKKGLSGEKRLPVVASSVLGEGAQLLCFFEHIQRSQKGIARWYSHIGASLKKTNSRIACFQLRSYIQISKRIACQIGKKFMIWIRAKGNMLPKTTTNTLLQCHSLCSMLSNVGKEKQKRKEKNLNASLHDFSQ